MMKAIAFYIAVMSMTAYVNGQGLAAGADSPAGRLQASEALYPPWQGGENNDALQKGLEFTVPPVDVMVDFHGSLDHLL